MQSKTLPCPISVSLEAYWTISSNFARWRYVLKLIHFCSVLNTSSSWTTSFNYHFIKVLMIKQETSSLWLSECIYGYHFWTALIAQVIRRQRSAIFFLTGLSGMLNDVWQLIKLIKTFLTYTFITCFWWVIKLYRIIST